MSSIRLSLMISYSLVLIRDNAFGVYTMSRKNSASFLQYPLFMLTDLNN